jgi:AraC-like DNA-binding protein
VNARYHSPRGRITYRRSNAEFKESRSPRDPIPRVVTLVESSLETPIVDATGTCCSITHTRSIPEAIFATRERGVRALLVSPNAIVAERVPRIASLISKCSGLLTVAVLREPQTLADQRLLELGSLGVRNVVDLSSRDGWSNLRALVVDASEGVAPLLLEPIMAALTESSPESRRFMEALIRTAPRVTTVRELARDLGVHPSSLMSRFHRSRLPAPKRYLAATRLLYASAYFENSQASVASIAHRLDYSSPQSFGRHVRTMMGMTASHFRYRFPLQRMIDHFIRALINPHRDALLSFDPWRGGISERALFPTKGKNAPGEDRDARSS